MTEPVKVAAGLPALLMAPAVDRWAERFDAWVEGRLGDSL